MSAELPLHPDYKDVSYTPISFAVLPTPEQGAMLSLPHKPLLHQQGRGQGPSPRVAPTPPPFRSSVRSASRPSLMTTPAMRPRRATQVEQSFSKTIAKAEPVLQPYPPERRASASTRPMPALAPTLRASSLTASNPNRSSSPLPAPPAARPLVATKSKQRSRVTLLQSIGTLKWGSMALASALFAAAFATYGWTVTLERRGSDLNEQLTQLRSHEKGMAGMAAALGATMAGDSQKPESGLHLPSPGGIFPLELEEPRPLAVEEESANDVRHFRRNQPRGY